MWGGPPGGAGNLFFTGIGGGGGGPWGAGGGGWGSARGGRAGVGPGRPPNWGGPGQAYPGESMGDGDHVEGREESLSFFPRGPEGM